MFSVRLHGQQSYLEVAGAKLFVQAFLLFFARAEDDDLKRVPRRLGDWSRGVSKRRFSHGPARLSLAFWMGHGRLTQRHGGTEEEEGNGVRVIHQVRFQSLSGPSPCLCASV